MSAPERKHAFSPSPSPSPSPSSASASASSRASVPASATSSKIGGGGGAGGGSGRDRDREQRERERERAHQPAWASPLLIDYCAVYGAHRDAFSSTGKGQALAATLLDNTIPSSLLC